MNIAVFVAEENSKADEPKAAEPPQKTEDPPQGSL